MVCGLGSAEPNHSLPHPARWWRHYIHIHAADGPLSTCVSVGTDISDKRCVTAVLLMLEGVIQLNTQIHHPRQHLKDRHNNIVAAVANEFERLGFDVVRAGYEAGGHWFDPDLFIQQPAGDMGFFIEVKAPQSANIAIDLDEWFRFRELKDVTVLAVFDDGRTAVLDVDNDRPYFWGAAADDCIPVLAAGQLIELDVPLRLFKRGDPKYTSNKPFVVFRSPRQFDSLREAIDFILQIKVGGSGAQL